MAIADMVEGAPVAAHRSVDIEAVDMDEYCEQQAAAAGEGAHRQSRSMKVAAVLLGCMVAVAVVAAAGVDQTARPRPESELLTKADDALQGGKLHALASALTKRNQVLAARRAEKGTGSPEMAMAAQARAVQRSASKLVMAPKTMTRGKMLDEEPAPEEEAAPAAEEPAADESPAEETEPQPEGVIKGSSDDAMASEIGNLKPTGIMGVFFSGHTFLIAVGIIISLLLAICLFARYADCALT